MMIDFKKIFMILNIVVIASVIYCIAVKGHGSGIVLLPVVLIGGSIPFIDKKK